MAAVLVLALAILVPAMSAGAAAPTTETVTNCNNAGAGSLRDAVQHAASGATVTFALSPPCPDITLASAIPISRDLTVDGPGASALALSGNNAVEVLHVGSDATVTIKGLTIESGSSTDGGGIFNDGALTVIDSTVSGNSATTGGGGLWNDGTLDVTDSTVSGNLSGYYGAGIYSGAGATLNVTGSTLSDNKIATVGISYPGYAYGGGIYAYGDATVADSTVSDNSVTALGGGGGGGGIYGGGTLDVTDSTVSANIANVASPRTGDNGGGGIANGGAMDITDSTVSDNVTDADGGGLLNAWILNVSDSTVSGNSAPVASGGGGGVFNDGDLGLTAVTLWNNSAGAGDGGGIDDEYGGTAAAEATVVADSTSGGDCSGSIGDSGYDLDDDGSCGFTATTDHPDTPAGLDPAGLEDNGGPTQTISLDPGSAAIGAVDDPSLCSVPDQRGAPRPTPCDIGAVELVLTPQTITFTSTPPSDAVVGGPPYSVAATGGVSGNPVTFSIDPTASSVCSIAGSTVSFIGEGTCTIDANQAGNATCSAAPQAQQSFSVGPALQAITSGDAASGTVGLPFSFTVTTSGTPVPRLSERGRMPRPLTFTDNGDGTATISGTPAKAGAYHFVIRATFGRGRTRNVVTQAFTLTIDGG